MLCNTFWLQYDTIQRCDVTCYITAGYVIYDMLWKVCHCQWWNMQRSRPEPVIRCLHLLLLPSVSSCRHHHKSAAAFTVVRRAPLRHSCASHSVRMTGWALGACQVSIALLPPERSGGRDSQSVQIRSSIRCWAVQWWRSAVGDTVIGSCLELLQLPAQKKKLSFTILMLVHSWFTIVMLNHQSSCKDMLQHSCCFLKFDQYIRNGNLIRKHRIYLVNHRGHWEYRTISCRYPHRQIQFESDNISLSFVIHLYSVHCGCTTESANKQSQAGCSNQTTGNYFQSEKLSSEHGAHFCAAPFWRAIPAQHCCE